MKKNIEIIDAFWEKRNLGVSVSEVIINKEANISELSAIQELDSDLIYAKVQHENTEVIEKLILDNFKYSENQFSIQKRLKNFSINKIYKKLIRFLDTTVINTLEDAKVIFEELDKNLFTTDRIALDTTLGVKAANNRYKNWITDIINSGDYECCIIRTQQDSIPVGFYINRYNENTANCILGAVFNEFKSRGIGHCFIYFALENAIKNNCKILKTQISSNNVPVFNIYSSVFGFEITDNHVVLKK